jgi:IS5 family transposase
MICCARNGLHQSRGESSMIEMRRRQLSFGDGLIAEEVSDLREDWMKHADEVLADEGIEMVVYEALAKRHPNSRSRGRRGTPAAVVLRLLTLKHIRNWSYERLEYEVRANLVYRDFTRVGAGKVPDARRWAAGARCWDRRCSSRFTSGW